MKELRVQAIEHGTVIDHIPSENTFKVIDILHLNKASECVLIATNLPSKSLGSKGLVKVSGKTLTQDEANRIALVAPDATINIIKDYEVVQKIKVSLPERLVNVVRCFNPRCITNNEQIPAVLHVESQKPLRLRCHYCERTMTEL
ncbi:MAG: aspartate carbamoyltransferase regulatory subunit [Nanoarchaeota archaeon]